MTRVHYFHCKRWTLLFTHNNFAGIYERTNVTTKCSDKLFFHRNSLFQVSSLWWFFCREKFEKIVALSVDLTTTCGCIKLIIFTDLSKTNLNFSLKRMCHLANMIFIFTAPINWWITRRARKFGIQSWEHCIVLMILTIKFIGLMKLMNRERCN